MEGDDKTIKIVGWANLNIDGEVFVEDGIVIPRDGIPLKVNRAETAWLSKDDVEIVADPKTGLVSYMTLTAEGFKKVMEEMHETWERTSSEEK